MAKPASMSAARIEKIGRVSTQSVHKGTGKSWDQWIAILDRHRARTWLHGEITLLLKTKYKLGPWWQQGVALGYEIHSGTRVEGRNAKGLYGVTATKILPLRREKAWKLLTSPEGLLRWLEPERVFRFEKGAQFEVPGGAFGEVRTVNAPARARLSWKEDAWAKPSYLQVHLNLRPGEKCNFVIQHDGIPSLHAKELLRVRWREALQRFAISLPAPASKKGKKK